ncbi:MAG: NUDIX hydrolase [Bacillota bacterium]
MEAMRLDEYLKRDPGYVPAWRYAGHALSNPEFACFEQVVVVEGGCVLWDQVAVRERPGVVVVPYSLDPPAVGLVEARRPVAGLLASLEFPRGFVRAGEPKDEAVARELAEEAGWEPRALTWLGRVNPNTAFYATSAEVCAALVDRWDGRPDGAETRRVLAVPPGVFLGLVSGGRIACGLTLAAGLLFLARCGFLSGSGRQVCAVRSGAGRHVRGCPDEPACC